MPLDAFPNHRWQKCFREMSYADVIGYQVFRQPVAEYLFRHWNEEHPQKRLVKLDLVFCMEIEEPVREVLARVSD